MITNENTIISNGANGQKKNPITDPKANKTGMSNASKLGLVGAGVLAGSLVSFPAWSMAEDGTINPAIADGEVVKAEVGKAEVVEAYISPINDAPEIVQVGDIIAIPPGGVVAGSQAIYDGELQGAVVSDDLSFAQAFAQARAETGAGGIFYWHGKPYGTFMENEWSAMPESQKDEYWSDVFEYAATHHPPVSVVVVPVNPVVVPVEPIVDNHDLFPPDPQPDNSMDGIASTDFDPNADMSAWA